MRPLDAFFAMGLVYAVAGCAAPIPGGPCVEGTVQEYADLGLAGCAATVGDINLKIRLGFIGYPTGLELSAILIQPSFSAISPGNRFEQSFFVSLIPGSWQGLPGQNFSLAVGFNEVLDRSLAAIAHTVGGVDASHVRAEVCLGGFYMLPAPNCGGDAHTATASGESVSIAAADPSPRTAFAVSGLFVGPLPNGNFSGLTLTSEVTVAAIPEPSTYVLLIIGTIAFWLLKLCIAA